VGAVLSQRVCALLCLILLLGPSIASAVTLYKFTDNEGNVIYSDEPRPGAVEIEVPTEPAGIGPIGPIAPRELPETPAPTTEEIFRYRSIAIVAPADDAILDEPTGLVNVALRVEPVLRVDKGHAFRVRLDDQVVEARSSSSWIVIPNVDRGEHVLQAMVVDADGKALITSAPVTFLQRRPSRLIPPDAELYPPRYWPIYPPQPGPKPHPPKQPRAAPKERSGSRKPAPPKPSPAPDEEGSRFRHY